MDKQVNRQRRIGIYGNQLILSAIGAGLREKPEFDVRIIEGLTPDASGKPDVDLPDVILFDLSAAKPHFAISLIEAHPAIMLIGVDLAKNRMLVLSGKQSRLLTGEDLVQVIEAGP